MTTRRDVGGDRAAWHALLGGGTAATLTDGQLLERFAAGAGDVAEGAFAALVERHGGMVLRACRGVLGNDADAGDAFQAAFLALARRGPALWVRESVGPWLHRVAVRAATRARRQAERRRAIERRAAIAGRDLARPAADDVDARDRAAAVHAEVDRLPEHYRVAVLLCDLEGRTIEEAARDLGCPVGTVKSRLSRARDRLRARLARRGLAPGLLPLAPGGPPVPAALARAAVAGAARVAARTGPAATALAAVARSGPAWGKGALVVFGVGLVALGVEVAGRSRHAGRPTAPSSPPARPLANVPPAPPVPLAPALSAPPRDEPPGDRLAWRRVDRYEPPNFFAYFADDRRGGADLGRAWADAAGRDRLPAAAVVPLVRRGLRSLPPREQDEVLKWLGQRFIWNAATQDPAAIELMYHAADPRGPRQGTGELTALYYGLMRVRPTTPAILHALADYCMAVDNTMDWTWAERVGRGHRDELVGYLRPHLDSPDPALRERAAVVAAVLRGDPDCWKAYNAWTTGLVRARFGDRLPGLIATLRAGPARERLDALGLIAKERLTLLLDEPFAESFRVCAGDPDPTVRRRVAAVLGRARPDGSQPGGGTLVDVLLGLLADGDPRVRYDAVYYGITSPLTGFRDEDIIRGLAALALRDNQPGLRGRIAWTLQNEKDRLARVLDESLRGPDPGRAEAARGAYKELTGQDPPDVAAAAPDARAGYVASFRGLIAELQAKYPMFALKGIDRDALGADLIPRVEAARTRDEFGLLVMELLARLEDSHAAVLPGTATPPRPSVPYFPECGPGIACLLDDRDRPVVYDVPAGTPAHRLGVRPGMAVVAVNGVPAAAALATWMARQRRYVGYSSDRALRYDAARQFLWQPERGAPVALDLEDPDGRALRVDLKADRRGGYIRRLPVERPGIDDGQGDVQSVRLDDGIGYLLVRRLRPGLEVGINQALGSLKGCDGLIVDVRGNSGGGFDAATAFRNFDRDLPAVPPDPGLVRYDGPIALLIDERCISAGEGWASWFVARKRARLFGATTAGASSRKETYELANALYKVTFSVKAYDGFLGRPIERTGLEPDVSIRPNARDLANGRDTVAEAAVGWLKEAREK